MNYTQCPSLPFFIPFILSHPMGKENQQKINVALFLRHLFDESIIF